MSEESKGENIAENKADVDVNIEGDSVEPPMEADEKTVEKSDSADEKSKSVDGKEVDSQQSDLEKVVDLASSDDKAALSDHHEDDSQLPAKDEGDLKASAKDSKGTFDQEVVADSKTTVDDTKIADIAEDEVIVRRSVEVVEEPEIEIPIYDVTKLRKSINVADIGPEGTALYHTFGNDLSRRGNLHLIADNVVVYVCGNAVVFENVDTKAKDYLIGIDENGVGCVAVHPSRTKFAVGGKGFQPNIYVYSYPDKQVLNVLRGGAERGYASLAFNLKGDRIASVAMSPDFILTVWEWKQERIALHAKAFGQDVYSVRFSLDDERRLTTCGTGHIRFWKMAATFTGLKLQGSIGKFGKVELSDVAAFVELPDGKVVSGTESGSLLLWEGNFIKARFIRGVGRLCHDGEVTYVEFDREDKRLATAGKDGYIRWWDFHTVDSAEVDADHSMDFELTPLAEYFLGEGKGIRSMVDGGVVGGTRSFFVLDTSGSAQVVQFPLLASKAGEDTNNNANKPRRLSQVIQALSAGDPESVPKITVISQHHCGAIAAIDTSPKEHFAATCGKDMTVRCWDYTTRTELTCRKFDTRPTALRWVPPHIDPSCRSFMVGFSDGVVRMLKITHDAGGNVRLKRKMAFKPHSGDITDISFSEKNTYLATAAVDGIVFFFDCNDNQGVDNSWTPLRFARMNKAKSVDDNAAAAGAPTPAAAVLGDKVIVAQKLSWGTTNDTVLCTCSDGLLREIDVYDMVQVGGKRFNSQDTRSFEGSFPITEHVIKVPAGMTASGSTASVAPTASASAGDASAGGGGALASSASSSNLGASVEANNTPVRTSYAIYMPGSSEILVSSTTQGNQGKNFLLKCPPLASPNVATNLILQPPPPEELNQGVYSSDGKDASRSPLPTAIVHSWSNQFLAVGNSDGSVNVRWLKHPAVFARFVAHNGNNGGVSGLAISFDDNYVLSVGKDGLLAVHRVRRDLFESKGVSLAKDLEAGIFMGKSTKELVVGPNGEPAYMTEVHSDEGMNDWSLFPSDKDDSAKRTAEEESRKREAELEKLIPESMDIEPGAYSIQDAKLQSEEDQRKIAAENLKEKVRHQIRALRVDFEAIKKRNDELPKEVRLSEKEMEVDGDYFKTLEEEGKKALDEVHKECAYEAEKAQLLRKKLVTHLMEGLLMDEIPLSAFVVGDTEGTKKSTLIVRSLRCQGIDPAVEEILGDVYEQLRSEEAAEKKLIATENAKSHAQQALSDVQEKIAERNRNTEEDEPDMSDRHKSGVNGDSTKNFSAEARRENRRKRKEKLSQHLAKKPSENDDDARDVAAIHIAEKTVGDYKLKVSDDYEIPEDQRVNAAKKKRQMALLEESMVAMRLRFNEQFLALRQLKREIVHSIRRDNARIREIDAELGQTELSDDLWEPHLDPMEYLDDFQEVTQEELEHFRKVRESTPWLKAIAPPHSVISGEKSVIKMNDKTGDYDTRRRDPFAGVDIANAENFFADTSKMNVLPPREDEPKSYEVRDIVLENLLKRTYAKEEAKRILALEETVPVLMYARNAMKKKSPVIAPPSVVAASSSASVSASGIATPTGKGQPAPGKFKLTAANFTDTKTQSVEQQRAWEERSRRLRTERWKLTEKTKTAIDEFQEALENLRVERHSVTADLKLAEMKLLTLFQEYMLLQTFESKDISLQQRQLRCEKEKSEITQSTLDSKTKLDHKMEELKTWSDKTIAVHADLKNLLPDSHPFADILTKIFKKKIKRSKASGGNEEDDEEEEEDDVDDDDDEEEVDDACPPGCDRVLHEKVLELREKRADIDDVVSDIQKNIDEMKKAMDRLKQREKQIAKDASQAEVEVRQFQLQKQAALNQIQIAVPLSISQLYAFEASGKLTGPTDKITASSTVNGEAANGAADTANADAVSVGSQQKELLTLDDVPELANIEERRLVPEISMSSHVIFRQSAMVRLQTRIGELHQEIDEARQNFKELHKERVRLNKEREIRRAEIESWEKRCNDLQMLKFGRLVDLDKLEEGSDRTKEHEAEAIVKLVEDRGRVTEYKLRREMEELEEELAQLTLKNTDLLNTVATLTEAKLNITRELNDTGSSPAVSFDTKQADKIASEERQRLKAYVDIQAREIAALQAEITMLKRKDIPPLPSLMSQSQPIGSVGFGAGDLRSQSAGSPSGVLAGENIAMMSQSQQQRVGESILPPIPGVTRSKSQGASIKN